VAAGSQFSWWQVRADLCRTLRQSLSDPTRTTLFQNGLEERLW
jgi:hypothetical protein